MKNTLQEIPLREILLSKHNPRKIKPKDPAIAELAKSIDESGLLQPVVCRPMAEGFELLAGARRFEAHRLLGRNTILALVRDLNDQQAIEVTVLENLQRENLTPLEEGRGVKELLDSGKDPKAIASDIGKSVAWVFKRAKLVDLVPEIVKIIEDPERNYWNQLSAAHLELIARLPAERQRKIMKDSPYMFEDPGTVDELAASLAREEMVLDKAGWDLETECAACFKRSDVQPFLFAEEGKPILLHKARCLDPDCWKVKAEAFLARQEADLRAKHPNLIKVSARDSYDSTPGVLPTWRFKACKKSASGAQPAIVVSGKSAGKLTWVIIDKDHVDCERPAGPRTMKQKQAELESKRWAEVVFRFRESLEEVPFEKLDGGHSTLCRLVATFGTGCLLHQGEAMWPAFEKTAKTPLDVDRAIWKHVVSQLRSIMAYMGPVTQFSLKGEEFEAASRTAELVGFDLNSLFTTVASEKGFTVPKSWAAEKKDSKKVDS